jgi:phosphohistidine phosphatase
MRKLLLLRHAKSSWDDEGMPDIQRPLNKRGRRTAPRMAEFLAAEGLLPARMLCSPAVRARETAALIVEFSGYDGPLDIAEALYPTTVSRSVSVLAELGGDAESVLLVGHNPGLEELVSHFTGRYEPMPTCALAEMDLSVDGWGELSAETTGTLIGVSRPKDLFGE